MTDCDYRRTWYHGSPFQLTTLRPGSTLTQQRDLARVFSHKPTLVSISDDGHIKHNGATPGFLYRISEEVQPGDVTPHPHSAMDVGQEWLTNRPLRLVLIGPTQIVPDERLTEEELAELQRRLSASEAGARHGLPHGHLPHRRCGYTDSSQGRALPSVYPWNNPCRASAEE